LNTKLLAKSTLDCEDGAHSYACALSNLILVCLLHLKFESEGKLNLIREFGQTFSLVVVGCVHVRKCKNFEKMLLSVIDESMKQIFGEGTTKSIYHYLENDYSLKYPDIPQKPEVFAKGLEEIFRSGSRVVEAVIISNLYSKIGLPCQKRKGQKFADYITELEKAYKSKK
jgi:hypothetical protein